jgi:hypothetical protein
MAWEFEHSVECQVSRDFAWRFWTNVANWTLDTSVESVTLFFHRQDQPEKAVDSSQLKVDSCASVPMLRGLILAEQA